MFSRAGKVGVCCGTVLVGLSAFWLLRGGRGPAEMRVAAQVSQLPAAPEPLPVWGRARDQIAEVSAESFEETLANLGHWSSFEFRNWKVCTPVLPLPTEAGGNQLARLLSNRRFLKVYEGFSMLPPSEAGELINSCGQVWLKEYRESYEAYLEKGRKLCPAGREPQIPAWDHPREDGLPSLNYMALRLLSLALVAGNLELEEARPFVLQLAAEALSQRRQLYQDGDFAESFRVYALDLQSLYNRQVLGYALLMTSSDPAPVEDAFAALGLRAEQVQLTAFDVARTPYYCRLMPGPVDYSKGMLTVEYLPPINDDEFDALLAGVLQSREEAVEDERPL